MDHHAHHCLRPALGVALVALSLILGCESSDPTAIQDFPAIPVPEAEFEWVVKRLQHLLEDTNPSGSLGLRSKREMTYELIPPADPQSNFKASITITSKTFYVTNTSPPKKPTRKDKQKVDPSNFDALLEDDLFENSFQNPVADFSDLATERPLFTNERVAPPRVDSKETFELIYAKGHWQLTQEPESERARNWFNYALLK